MKTTEQTAATVKTLEARRNANAARATYNAAKESGWHTCAALRGMLADADAASADADACEEAEAAGMFPAAGPSWFTPEGVFPSVRPRVS